MRNYYMTKACDCVCVQLQFGVMKGMKYFISVFAMSQQTSEHKCET